MKYATDTYWNPVTSTKQSSSNMNKVLAIMAIALITIGAGSVLLYDYMTQTPTVVTDVEVKVAVIDSGIDIDSTLLGRVSDQRSFILTQYGYPQSDPTTGDSSSDDVPHGTLVAKTIIDYSANALIVNAKVLDSSGSAPTLAIIDAIYWAYEVNCSVINLSLGSLPTYGDPLEDAIEWVINQGVVVVAAAGNENEGGLQGNTINSPSILPGAISVAAIGTTGNPLSFSSRGPTAERTMKPDISAEGYFVDIGGTYQGTSFSSPRVAGVAAELIAYCIDSNILYTPGSIKAALLEGATPLSASEYAVGAGKVNLQGAVNAISDTTEGELPEITYLHPQSLPIEYEKLFYGDTYTFYVQVINSWSTDYDISIDSDTPSVFSAQSQVTINQTGFVPITVEVPLISPTSTYDAVINFTSSEYGSDTMQVQFTAYEPVARVAFDISYTTWSIDTIYGQFRELYTLLTDNEISVTEIRDSSEITLSYLQEFDGVLILDPFAWDVDESTPLSPDLFSLDFTISEKQAYEDYFDAGGGIFIAALSNATLDISKLNSFIDWSGISLDFDQIPLIGNTLEVVNLYTHPITSGISSFDYNGAGLNVPGYADVLARGAGHELLAALETTGRLVVTGSNFMVDNWALLDEYHSMENDDLALQIIQWICELI
jgi:hypothetical protein